MEVNLLVVIAILINISLAHICEWKVLSHNAIYFDDVSITIPNDVLFFWKANDDVNTATLKFTIPLNVTIKKNGYSILYDVRKNGNSALLPTPQRVDSPSNCNRWNPSFSLVALTILPIFLDMRKSTISLFLLLVLVSLVQTSTNHIPDCHHPSISLEIPTKYIRKICINDQKCIPTVCQLHLQSSFSNVRSNLHTMFLDDFCTIRKPDRWNEWTGYWFNYSQPSEDLYFADHDQDGLVNLLEFYANKHLISQNESIANVGSNPFKRDTDGDGLEDGYESLYGLNVTVYDQPDADYDGDSLSNVVEQQHNTNPMLADTDGDNLTDSEELGRLSCPNDASDRGQVDISLQHAFIKVTIGDPKFSGSEAYRIDIGSYILSSSRYNGDTIDSFKFGPGAYKIRITHINMKFHQPFYSYTALVQQIGGLASSTVVDEMNLLGTHVNLKTFQSIERKVAWLIVRRNCTYSLLRHQICSCMDTCEQCSSEPKCIWDKKHKCRLKKAWKGDVQTTNMAVCPCTKCSVWFRNDSYDRTWLYDLMKDYPCPCKVKSIKFAGNYTRLKELDNTQNIKWGPDYNCMDNGLPYCHMTNHGANGCILSSPSKYGARQQCCYDTQGNLIQSHRNGAGKARKSPSQQSYVDNDFFSYNQCCNDCHDTKQCSNFKSLRQSATSQCSPISDAC